MKRSFLRTMSSGLALALVCAPLALAQQMQNHSDDTHGAPAAHPTMQHTAPGPAQHETMSRPEMAPTHNSMAMQHSAPMQPPHEDHTAPMHMASSGHDWHNGDHFNGSRHPISNWSYYHLHQPPQGYEWVQDGDQFVLIAVTSGIIADVIANALYQ